MKNNNYNSASWSAFATRSLVMLTTVSIFMLYVSTQASAQATNTQTIRGVVKSGENNEPVPGTNIFLKGANTVGTLADAEGQFEFPRALKPGDIIVFSFVGLKTTEYVVPEQAAGLVAIVMLPDYIQMVDEIWVEGAATAQPIVSVKSSRRINR